MKDPKKCTVVRKNSVSLGGVECRPGKVFAGLIEKFWFYDTTSSADKTFEILPDGNFDLVFILNDACCTLIFLGPYTRKIVVPIMTGKQYFGVRFRPGRMPRLGGIQPAELVDTMIELPEILDVETNSLGESLLNAKAIDAKRTVMEEVFQRNDLELLARQDLCNRCAELIEFCNGRIQVGDLAHRVGTSMRTLERTFLQDLGLSPKLFIRLVRFQNAVKKLKSGGYSTLTHIAYECGYADQSHFIKDFQHFARKVPSASSSR